MLHEAILKLVVKLQIFLQEKDGASGIEYAIVAAMVAVVIAAFIGPIGTRITAIFNAIEAAVVST
ncbi:MULTISPECIES: Flp family type IVb pilin [Pseudomonas]|jgi:pilus assembly protein Flp/PilA|uniref:Flp family type IVb pilin n=1 Tax=Pseudomonas gingeri TaxID=117681 RepID=A0A7Y7WF72_9PSED|nr:MULTISPECIES: Flp family type IVb pilin [Pseudomonas]MCU1741844.1 Flp family type IVb pilin [Pseudomonas sp. 20S_6.2_Bac1]NWB48302.1 Flp family type IVb pilin [Pseudomonas gingeri]